MIKNRRVAVTEQQETADGCNDLEGHEAACPVLYASIWGCRPAHAEKGRWEQWRCYGSAYHVGDVGHCLR